MRKIFILFILTLYNLTVYGQTISGTITDSNTKEVLIGVNIILENGKGISSDIFGKYTLNTEEGIQKISFKYIGYKEVVKEFTLNKEEQKTINVSLESSAEQLSTVVVSAGRFEQQLEEITVSMEVIKPTLIENKNTTNIETVIDQIPSVNIIDGQANIRGGSGWSYGAGTRVLVMVDDMPLVSGDAGQVQWKLIATENINQIEVIKGASSALYGSSALNGVINIRTAFPSQKKINNNPLPGYTKVNMHFGLIDFPKRAALNWNGDKRRAFKGLEFSQAMKVNNTDISFGGNVFKDDGYRYGESTDRKRFNFNTNHKSKKIIGLAYGLNGNFILQESGSALLWNGFDEAYIPLDSAISTTKSTTYNIDPFINYTKGNNQHSLRIRYLSVTNDNSSNGKDIGQDNASNTIYTNYQYQKNIKEYQLRITSGITNEIVQVNSDLFNGKSQRTNNALYTQIDKKWNRLNISLGGRYEYFSINTDSKHFIDGDSINEFSAQKPVFRAGLNYQLAEATFLRGSWGQGFRFPAMSELFISTNQSGLEIYPNPELKPESGWSSEIGIKQGIKIGNWLSYLDLAAFLMQYDNMMEFSFGQWGGPENTLSGLGFKSVNVGSTQISGVELSINGQGKLNKNTNVNILAGYTYMNPISLDKDYIYARYYKDTNGDGIDDGDGRPITYLESGVDSTVLKYRHKHIIKFDAELIYKKYTLGGSFRYNDFMRNIDYIFTTPVVEQLGITGINESRADEKGDYIIDMRAAYQIIKTAKLSFIVNNLLNREYMSRPANMMPPRTFTVQLNFKI